MAISPDTARAVEDAEIHWKWSKLRVVPAKTLVIEASATG
jgi:hypothetical protein